MKVTVYALGQQTQIDMEYPDGLSCEKFIESQGYNVGIWYESDEFQITVGEKEEQPCFMLGIYTAFYGYYVIAQTVLDYSDVLGKLSSFSPLTAPERQPDWASEHIMPKTP